MMLEKSQDANAENLNPGHRNDVPSESGSRKISLPGKKEPWFNGINLQVQFTKCSYCFQTLKQ